MESGMDKPAPHLVLSQQQQCTSRCGEEGRARWDSIPLHLRIQVLHVDPDILVISKPCNLRSVPGHAKPPPTSAKRKRPANDEDDDDDVHDKPRKTAQEAWVDAIRTFRSSSSAGNENDDDDDETEETRLLLTNLANTNHVSGVPRKPKLFTRYCERNLHRLLPSEPTPDEDSAYGQLKLLGYETHDEEIMEIKGDKISTKGMIYIVHRLDCEVRILCTLVLIIYMFRVPCLVLSEIER
jgi:hypothetical protein